jgi:hypothetical protein
MCFAPAPWLCTPYGVYIYIDTAMISGIGIGNSGRSTQPKRSARGVDCSAHLSLVPSPVTPTCHVLGHNHWQVTGLLRVQLHLVNGSEEKVRLLHMRRNLEMHLSCGPLSARRWSHTCPRCASPCPRAETSTKGVVITTTSRRLPSVACSVRSKVCRSPWMARSGWRF